MAITRSHRKFDDIVEDDIKVDEKDGNKEKPVTISDDDDDDSGSDSDEAPEEESVSVSKAKVLEKQKEDQQLVKKKRDEAKAKQRAIEERRKIEKLEKEIRELEKQRKELNNIEVEEIPDELPEELLENFDVDKKDKMDDKRKKIVFNETEEDANLVRANKRRIREERLKKLREIRGVNEKKVEGGIHVKMLKDSRSLGGISSSEISSKKEQWLNRKRIRRE